MGHRIGPAAGLCFTWNSLAGQCSARLLAEDARVHITARETIHAAALCDQR
jgi:hypothetical protein